MFLQIRSGDSSDCSSTIPRWHETYAVVSDVTLSCLWVLMVAELRPLRSTPDAHMRVSTVFGGWKRAWLYRGLRRDWDWCRDYKSFIEIALWDRSFSRYDGF